MSMSGSNSSGNESCQDYIGPVVAACGTALTVVCPLAALLNAFIMFSAVKLYKRTADAVHSFVFSMTLGDFLLTAVGMPLEHLFWTSDMNTVPFGSVVCAVQPLIMWLGVAASGLSLVLLNLDKMVYFQQPLRYDSLMSQGRALGAVCVLWLGSAVYVAGMWLWPGVVSVSPAQCLDTHVSSPFYELHSLVVCVLPIVSSAALSLYLVNLTSSQGRKCRVNAESSDYMNKLRSLVFIFATTVWTLVSLVPSRVFNVLRLHLLHTTILQCSTQALLMQVAAWIFFFLLALNPIVNAVITVVVYAPYRQRVLLQLRCTQRNTLYETEHTNTRDSFTRQSQTMEGQTEMLLMQPRY